MAFRAAVDVCAILPCPPTGKLVQAAPGAAADFSEGAQLCAHALGAALVISEANPLRTCCILWGEHAGSTITAIKWAPDCHSRDLKTQSHLRIASGDSEGRAVVWDVLAQQPTTRLAESLQDASGGNVIPAQGGVQGLAWVLSQPCLLAVLLTQGRLLLWDTKGGSVVWQRDLLSGEACCSLARDPLDSRRLAVCGVGGALILVCLDDPQANQVDVKSYRVALPPTADASARNTTAPPPAPSLFQAMFAPARDLLFLTLPRELLIFDTDLGVPAATISIPSSRPSFAALLGVYGRGVSQGLGDEGGVDVLIAAHVEGALSVWTRTPGELRFTCVCWGRLAPSPVRGVIQATGLLAVAATAQGVWAGSQAAAAQLVPAPDDAATRSLQLALLPDRAAADSSGGRDIMGGALHSSSRGIIAPTADTMASKPMPEVVMVISVTADGRLWQWAVPLPPYSTPTLERPLSPGSSPASAISCQQPMLLAQAAVLSQPTTCLVIYPLPVLAHQPLAAVAPTSGLEPVQPVVLLGAALTTGGHLEIVSIRQGAVSPLAIDLCACLSPHPGGVGGVSQGLAWLGTSPRIVSYVCEKVERSDRGDKPSAGGWRNHLSVTDIRSRRSTTFRETGLEPHRLVGARPSPTGFHLLLRFLGAPSELWAVGMEPPIKLMSLDIQWVAPEWSQIEDPTAPNPLSQQDVVAFHTAHEPMPTSLLQVLATQTGQSGQTRQLSRQGSLAPQATPSASSDGTGTTSAAAAGAPENGGAGAPLLPYKNPSNAYQVAVNAATAAAPTEVLVFSADEGAKCGRLLVKGRSVLSDYLVKYPVLPTEEGALFNATAVAAWGALVVMGDADGRLVVWQVATGACSLMHTGFGYLHRLVLAPAPHPAMMSLLEGAGGIVARVACLFSDGAWGVYELTPRGLRPGPCSPLVTARARGSSRLQDLAWLPVPLDQGGGCLLAGVLEGGGLVVLDVAQVADKRPHRPQRASTLSRLLATPTTLTVPPRSQSKPLPILPVADMLLDEEVNTSPTQVGGPRPLPQRVVLLTAPPLGAALLLPRTWLQLLRLLLQLGLSTTSLAFLAGLPALSPPVCVSSPGNLLNRAGSLAAFEQLGAGGLSGAATAAHLISSPQAQQESDVLHELLNLIPRATHKALLRCMDSGWREEDPSVTSHTQVRQGSSAGGAQIKPSPTQPADLSTTTAGVHSTTDILSGDNIAWHMAPDVAPGTGTANQPTSPTAGVGTLGLMKSLGDAFKMVKTTATSALGTAALMPSISGATAPRVSDSAADAHYPMAYGAASKGSGGAFSGHLLPTFHQDLKGLLHHLARCRANGQLLHPEEWEQYRAALGTAASPLSPFGTVPSTSSLQHSPSGGIPAQRSSSSLASNGSNGSHMGSGVAERVAPIAARMRVAAQLGGDACEAAFWKHLPVTLEAVRSVADRGPPWQHRPAGQLGPRWPGAGSAVPGSAVPAVTRGPHGQGPDIQTPLRTPGLTGTMSAPPGVTLTGLGGLVGRTGQATSGRLWDEDATLCEAQERALWHETLSRSVFQSSHSLQEKRMLEYVVLGDFQTAVAFLLASTPECSATYYRDALVTVALAAAANVPARFGNSHGHGHGVVGAPVGRQLGMPLQLQAAKVLSAHAASMDDPLLGVPLHCAAGLYAEAVALLQECGMWRLAATLTAHALTPLERGAALLRWARHVAGAEGSMWRGLGLLSTAGLQREALQALQAFGRPDCAAAYLAACQAAGLTHTTTVSLPAPSSPAPTSQSRRSIGALGVPALGRLSVDSSRQNTGGRGAGPLEQHAESGAGMDTHVPFQGVSAHSGGGEPVVKRLSISAGNILIQQAATVAVNSAALPDEDDSGTKKRLHRLDVEDDSEALLSQAFGAPLHPTPVTQVFSVLAAQEGRGNGGATDDLGPVQLAFERHITDVLYHI